ncbi:MAG: knotted carbamoyltransferase YgeW [Planctomycetes bacterium]|nr:knotted carbamoyltransferase YgeW [Planctomycetota bacterium]
MGRGHRGVQRPHRRREPLTRTSSRPDAREFVVEEKLTKKLDALATRTIDLHNRDYLLTWERSPDELHATLLAADVLRDLYLSGRRTRLFDGGLAVSNFRDNSTRTRFSFASAASLLGLSTQDLDESRSQIAHGETVRETANMISFLSEVIGIRDYIFLGEGHKYMVEVGAALDDGYRAGVLPQRPAVINLQCDLDHPTQSLADLMHLQQVFGSLEALRGRKIAMTWAHSPSYGKPLSVPQGIITLMTRFGMNVVLAHPEGYDLVPDTLELAGKFARQSGGSFAVTHDLAAAFRDAHVVYPKSWAPYRVMQERTRLLRGGENEQLAALEKECLAQNLRCRDWECTEKLMATTRGDRPVIAGEDSRNAKQALYMHCLPADITDVTCKVGEVSASVFERYRLATYREASYKPFIIAAMIVLTRFAKPAEALRTLAAGGGMRRGGDSHPRA